MLPQWGGSQAESHPQWWATPRDTRVLDDFTTIRSGVRREYWQRLQYAGPAKRT